MDQEKADIVTVSNAHPNHSNVEGVGGDPRVIDGPGEFEIGGYYITGTATAPKGDEPEPSMVNTIYTIRAEGVTICHLGNLSQPLSPGQTQQLNDTDVLIVPVGDGCAIEPAAAAELVNAISPRIVIPVDYGTDDELSRSPARGYVPGTDRGVRGRSSAKTECYSHQPAEGAEGHSPAADGLAVPSG